MMLIIDKQGRSPLVATWVDKDGTTATSIVKGGKVVRLSSR